MTALCLICRHRTTTHADEYACPICTDDLRAWLTDLPRQAALLQEFVAPGSRPAEGRLGGTGRAHSPAPADLRVLTLLGPGRYDPHPGTDDDGTPPIHAVLTAWAGHIAYTYPAAHRDPYGTARTEPCEQAWPSYGFTIPGWCAWLTAYLPYTLTLPAVADLHRDLGDLIRRIRDLTHDHPHTHPMAAPCPACQAFALARTDGHWHTRCHACGHTLTPDQYAHHAAEVLDAHQASDGTAA
ncbi:hypothetical protein [Streptomyces sp. bgisy154]|uniref:hypothetical protein n=1 Tax=Streptomyces sp. bgisy154 TaxID=3413794 RepID=UPI003D749797